ncbi:MAG: nuclear transport factor 2 family protein [Candidatus Poriferisodalaceae bacterium]
MIVSETLAQELFARHEEYLQAFLNNDYETYKKIFASPVCVFMGDGFEVFDEVPDLAGDAASGDGWVRSEFTPYEVIAVSETKAHLAIRNLSRYAENDRLLTSGSAMYIYNRIDGEWKISAISGILVEPV